MTKKSPVFTPEILKAWREKHDLTQAQASKAIRYSPRSWESWEQGKLPRREATQLRILLAMQSYDKRNHGL